MARPRRMLSTVATTAISVAVTAGCTVAQPLPEETPTGHSESAGDAAKARKELADLRVAAPGGDAGYARDRFGQRWKDTDHNGCDTRNDILARDLDDVTKRGRCVVVGGRLDDPYTGRDVTFVKARAIEVQIDHIYPLALAWRMGADDWTEDKRADFANDRDNLLAVWGRPNQQKGDSGPSEWRPRKAYQCRYAIKFVDVAAEYDLAVLAADHDALDAMLDRC
ncbi:MAG TPA: HNH endonuclease family protein [Streptosporangiaceae bacterium]|nr:HNH endonuclease family protein [Streptosporangiaceae bacterium]